MAWGGAWARSRESESSCLADDHSAMFGASRSRFSFVSQPGAPSAAVPPKPRINLVDQRVGLLALVVAHHQFAVAARQIGHVRAPLVEDQVQAGAQPIPAGLERRNARVAAPDLEGVGARGPTRLLRKAHPVLAADGQPNTCASAPKPPGVPKSAWTCGPGAQQAWATQVRSQRSVAVPPTRQSRDPAFLFRRASPESPYLNPSHHKGRPIAGCHWSPDLTSVARANSTKTYKGRYGPPVGRLPCPCNRAPA